MEFLGVRYKQDEQEYLSFICPMKYVIDNSIVLIYGKDKKYGYQRSPKKQHYLKISKSLMSGSRSVTPNSIVLGLNEDDLTKKFSITQIASNGTEESVKLVCKDSSDCKFRIIDGQHRIEGFKDAIDKTTDAKDKESLLYYKANIIVLLLDAANRLPEVRVFSDINSKAKPLKMDLTVLAEYQYTLLEKPSDVNEQDYCLATAIFILQKGDKCKPWKNAIIFDVNSTKKVGIVGFKTFKESIAPLLKINYSSRMEEVKKRDSYESKVELLDPIASELATLVADCWNCVFNKWPAIGNRWIEDEESNLQVYFLDDYYLQKTMGTEAINSLIVEAFKTSEKQETFKSWINNCTLSLTDWKTNGKFAGLSSRSGVSEIKKIILGKV